MYAHSYAKISYIASFLWLMVNVVIFVMQNCTYFDTLFRVLAQHNIIHDPGSFTCIREDYEETTLISSGTCYYHRRNLLRIEMLLFVSQVNPFTTDPLFNVVASLDPIHPNAIVPHHSIHLQSLSLWSSQFKLLSSKCKF